VGEAVRRGGPCGLGPATGHNDAATSPEYTGHPAAALGRNAQSRCCRGRLSPRRSRDRGSNAGQPRRRPRGRRSNGIRRRRTAAFKQRLAHWAWTSGDCAGRPRDRHVRGRGQCGAGARRRAQAAQGRRDLDHAGTRDDVAADESVLPLGHVSRFAPERRARIGAVAEVTTRGSATCRNRRGCDERDVDVGAG
jgi:hypothetical protein